MKMNMKKCLTTGIILLLFIVSIAPSINANISQNNEMVELTTEVYGLNGEKYTVKLTREEAEEVDLLIKSIKEKLDQAKTSKEVEDIFKNAVLELNRYGLLGDLNVKQVQRLVTKGVLNLKGVKLVEKLSQGKNAIWDIDSNNFCLISGKTTTNLFLGMLSAGVRLFSPLAFMNSIMFGQITEHHYYGTYHYSPSRGWVYTNGLKGIDSWDGKIWGNLNMFSFFEIYKSIFWLLLSAAITGFTPYVGRYCGVKGFSGITILFDDGTPFYDDYFYLGFALRVGLTYETPEHP
jgi:hypothetical protein